MTGFRQFRLETLEALEDEDVTDFIARLGCVACHLYKIRSMSKSDVSRVAASCTAKINAAKQVGGGIKTKYPTPKFENDLRRLGVIEAGDATKPWSSNATAMPGNTLKALKQLLDCICEPCDTAENIDCYKRIGAVVFLTSVIVCDTPLTRVLREFLKQLSQHVFGRYDLVTCSMLPDIRNKVPASNLASLYLRAAQRVITYSNSYKPPAQRKLERIADKVLKVLEIACDSCGNLPLLYLPLNVWRLCK